MDPTDPFNELGQTDPHYYSATVIFFVFIGILIWLGIFLWNNFPPLFWIGLGVLIMLIGVIVQRVRNS